MQPYIANRHPSADLARAAPYCVLSANRLDKQRAVSARQAVATAAALQAQLQSQTAQKAAAVARNVHWHDGNVTCEDKERKLQQQGCVLWFTGLSGAGKSTVACSLEQELFRRGAFTVLLDGDNVRHGLNSNLGFSEADRTENIRRVTEVAKLLVESGLICICSLISPLEKDRQAVRSRLPSGKVIVVFMKIPRETCEQRDPKGLWKAARAGKIKDFTGLDAPYEPPAAPEIILEQRDAEGNNYTPEQMACQIVDHLEAAGKIPRGSAAVLSNNAVSRPSGAKREGSCSSANGAGAGVLSVQQ